MFVQGTVFDPSSAATADGATATLNFGRANEALVSELHGKYFQQCYRGNVYVASTAVGGVVVPISTTLTPTYSIWNPLGSGKLCVPIVTLIGWSATTAALGTYGWTYTNNTGSAISATAPFVAFGSGTAINCNVGSGKVSQIRTASGGTTTLVAASTWFRTTGITTLATTVATTTAPMWMARDDWDGTCILPPGNAIHFMGSTAILTTMTISLVYAELPL